MMPLFFGNAARPLYGVYHPAAGTAGRGRGVVLCNPYGQEAFRAHRAYRILADALARERWHVLRFDYSCTGDSGGDDVDATLAQWIADAGAAIDELEALAALGSVHLAGLRFGATLASLTAAERSDVRGLILWEPIVNGADYVKELLPDWAGTADGPVAGEADGFRVPQAFARALSEVDVGGLAGRLPSRVLLLTSSGQDVHAALRDQLVQQVAGLSYEQLDDPRAWTEENNFGAGPVPAKTIDAVARWCA